MSRVSLYLPHVCRVAVVTASVPVTKNVEDIMRKRREIEVDIHVLDKVELGQITNGQNVVRSFDALSAT